MDQQGSGSLSRPGLRLDGGNTYGTRLSTSGSGPGLPGRGFLRGFLGSLLALPKLNGSWVISEEPWFPFKALFSSLRLRAAYGQSQVQPGRPTGCGSTAGRSTRTRRSSRWTWSATPNCGRSAGRSSKAGSTLICSIAGLSLVVTGYRKMQVDAIMRVGLLLSVNGGGNPAHQHRQHPEPGPRAGAGPDGGAVAGASPGIPRSSTTATPTTG